MPSTACRKRALRNDFPIAFAWGRRSSSCPPKRTKKILEIESQIAIAEAEVKAARDKAFSGWRSDVMANEQSSERKGLAETLLKTLAKADGDRTEDEWKALDPALRKHFDEKVRARLVSKSGPAMTKVDGLKKRLADYK